MPNQPGSELNRAQSVRAIALVLAVLTLLLYWPVQHLDFVNFDDHLYVYKNKEVQQGLNWNGVVWAFNAPHVSNWHPVTWLSHMLDCSLFGLNAGAHHVVSALIHTVNSVLFFLLLVRLTGALWPAALAAALFAWHPIQVESVAWVSERKNVLSTFFWLLTLRAYVLYVEKPGRGRYAWVLLWYVLGLMAKPMLVTLPFTLLLLDFWPLRRLSIFGPAPTAAAPAKASRATEATGGAPPVAHAWIRLVAEKWPFFVLSVVFSVIAMLTQRDVAMVPMTKLPLDVRLANALISYVRYVGKLVCPVNLAVFYPFPDYRPLWMPIGAAALLLPASWAIWHWARSRPYLLFGWLWYLGTLVPVIGLVQVGGQSMADRYAYVPFMGLFVALAWGWWDLRAGWARGRTLIGMGTVLALAGCLAATHVQLGSWQNSITLFDHATKVTRDNWVAHYNLGVALAETGRIDEAVAHYNAALQADPKNLDAVNNLGNLFERQGRHAEASALFLAVLKQNPGDADALNNLGLALAGAGKPEEAIVQYRRALELQPGFAKAHQNLALTLSDLGRSQEAIQEFKAALTANPEFVLAHTALAFELTRLNRQAEAEAHYREALRLQPDMPEARTGLGLVLASQNKLHEAEAEFAAAARLRPEDPRLQLYLGSTLAGQGRHAEALEHYRAAWQRSPDWPPLLENYAWLLATTPDARLRDGRLAAQLAEHSCELTRRQSPGSLDALAAALAETGQFPQAVAVARESLALLKSKGVAAKVTAAEKRLALYEAGQPWREGL